MEISNHREAWATEVMSPAGPGSDQTPVRPPTPNVSTPTKKIVEQPRQQTSSPAPSNIKTDTLVVVSKVKKLIKDQSEFNTSQCCIDALTQKVVKECLKGIENAKLAERKTVMGRDIIK